MRDFFGRYDLFLSPTAQALPFDVTLCYPTEVDGVPSETCPDWMRSACVISSTGLPALSVPDGFTTGGLPAGFQLVANRYDDVRLLRWGRAFEQRTRFAV